VSTRDEGSPPPPGHTERDSHVVTYLFAAYANALETGEADIGLRTASALWRFWHYWAEVREGQR